MFTKGNEKELKGIIKGEEMQMEQIILIWDEFKDIWDQCLQKLLLRLCTIPKLDIKEVREEEHSLLDNVEADSNMDLEITDQE